MARPNPRTPTAMLEERESLRVRELLREKGEVEARRLLGGIAPETLFKAGCGVPLARITVEALRMRMERLEGANAPPPPHVLEAPDVCERHTMERSPVPPTSVPLPPSPPRRAPRRPKPPVEEHGELEAPATEAEPATPDGIVRWRTVAITHGRTGAQRAVLAEFSLRADAERALAVDRRAHELLEVATGLVVRRRAPRGGDDGGRI